MVLTLPLIFNSFSLLTKPLWTAPCTLTTIGITFIFSAFLILWQDPSMDLIFYFLSFSCCGSLGHQNPLYDNCSSGQDCAMYFLPESLRIFSISFYRTNSAPYFVLQLRYLVSLFKFPLLRHAQVIKCLLLKVSIYFSCKVSNFRAVNLFNFFHILSS